MARESQRDASARTAPDAARTARAGGASGASARGGERAPELEATPTPDAGVGVEETSLRPADFASYIGQDTLKANLQTYVRAARARGEALDHVLLHGPPGLGKTTLSQLLARELGVTLVTTSGPAIDHRGALAGHLTSLQPNDLLFVDEIHRLPRAVEELLYSAMEDGRIDLAVGEGDRARTIPVAIAPFTLVGATTRPGMLSAPLRDRFHIVEELQFYNDEELQRIVLRASGVLDVRVHEDAALELGRRSRGTPRIALRLLRRMRDFVHDQGSAAADIALVRHGLARLEIDEHGLDRLDRRTLEVIAEVYAGGPVGIDAIAATMSVARDTLEDLVEPYLLQRGLLVRTSRGRMITTAGRERVGVATPPGSQTDLEL